MDSLDELENYECENQISLEQFLWDNGYYMPLPEYKEVVTDKD